MLYIFWKLSTFWIYCAQSFLIQSFTRHLVNDSMVAHLHELHFADQIKCVESEAKQSEPQQILPICLKLPCLALPTSPDPTHLRLNHPLSSGGSNSEQSCVVCIRQNCKMHFPKAAHQGVKFWADRSSSSFLVIIWSASTVTLLASYLPPQSAGDCHLAAGKGEPHKDTGKGEPFKDTFLSAICCCFPFTPSHILRAPQFRLGHWRTQ